MFEGVADPRSSVMAPPPGGALSISKTSASRLPTLKAKGPRSKNPTPDPAELSPSKLAQRLNGRGLIAELKQDFPALRDLPQSQPGQIH